MASNVYTYAKELILSTSINLLTDTIRVSIGRVSAYTFSASHQFKSEVATTQDATTALTSKTVTSGVFTATNSFFTTVPAGTNLNFICIWKDTGSANTSPVIAYLDGFTTTPNNNDITCVWPTTGSKIFKI